MFNYLISWFTKVATSLYMIKNKLIKNTRYLYFVGYFKVPSRRRAAEADHCDAQGYAGSAWGPFAWLPKHCHQGQWVAAAFPGLSQGGEVRRFDSEGHRTADGSLQFVWRLAEEYQLLHCIFASYPLAQR